MKPKHLLVCQPQDEERVRVMADLLKDEFDITVKANRYVPDGKVFLINPEAMALPPEFWPTLT